MYFLTTRVVKYALITKRNKVQHGQYYIVNKTQSLHNMLTYIKHNFLICI